jgi:hypothetical protein
VDKSVHEKSPLLSTRSHLLCPRDVCHPVIVLIHIFCRNFFLVQGVQKIVCFFSACTKNVKVKDGQFITLYAKPIDQDI